MGLFLDSLFGTGSAYSAVPQQLSTDQLQRLINSSHINTLTRKEEQLVEETIARARVNGAISLKKIDRVLRPLVSQHAISIHDKTGVLNTIQRYFESQT